MQKARKVKKGDTIGLIGPSGAIRTAGSLEKSIALVEELGFKVKVGESCAQKYGYLSGTDDVRARDVNAMFADDEIDAIICVKGGYGTMRMLDQLDYDLVRANPKIFMGYSDITAMHVAYLEKSGLVSFHGPMPASCWVDGLDEITWASMLDMLMNAPKQRVIANPEGKPHQTVNPGVCEGMLVGGNLSLIDGLLGTPYELDTKGRVLFLEDIGEKTYRLDHMLTHLRLAGKFEDCAGIVLGHFTDCPIEFPEFGLALEEIVRDIVAPCGKPVFSGFQVGHALPNLTIPFGVQCRMDADRGTITLLEAPLVD